MKVQIRVPCQSLKHISPFIMRTIVKPGLKSVGLVEFSGKHGCLLMREVRNYQSFHNEWVSLDSEMEFGINAVVESGCIQISMEDDQRKAQIDIFGRIDLTIDGKTGLEPTNKSALDFFYIESLRPNRLIQGGKMRGAGLARTMTRKPLMIEIRVGDGRILSTRQISVTPSPGSAFGTFATDGPNIAEDTNNMGYKFGSLETVPQELSIC